tara:strand:+ start:10478 stop:11395 length:918 start_codon:yes stop_codon:yes gene_type:complete
MGYTHYAYIPAGRIDDDEWTALQQDILLLTLDGDWEEKKVILTNDLIQVQGNHEWFSIPREPKATDFISKKDTYYTFTKTARKPYDYIIVACYMALYRCVKGVKLSSDGDYDELAEGRQHYAEIMCFDEDAIFELFADTIHDPRPEWYIGDPCYAINDHFWDDFCKEVSKFSHDGLEGDGIEFEFMGNKCYVYNSGLGGDGSFNVHGREFCVDAGLVSVLPARLVDEDRQGGHMVRSRLRPVFDIDTNNFPHITLTLDGDTQFANGGHLECDGCGEWRMINDTWSNNDGETVCVECEEEEDVEEY